MRQIKCIFLGAVGVGKSSILQRLSGGRFPPPSTIGIDLNIYESRGYKLLCWDTAGQRKFETVVRSFFRSAQVAVYVYDVTSKASLREAHDWYEKVKATQDGPRVHMLVGNKSDLQPVVTEHDVFSVFGPIEHLTCYATRPEPVIEVFETIIDYAQHTAEIPQSIEFSRPSRRNYYDCCNIA